MPRTRSKHRRKPVELLVEEHLAKAEEYATRHSKKLLEDGRTIFICKCGTVIASTKRIEGKWRLFNYLIQNVNSTALLYAGLGGRCPQCNIRHQINFDDFVQSVGYENFPDFLWQNGLLGRVPADDVDREKEFAEKTSEIVNKHLTHCHHK